MPDRFEIATWRFEQIAPLIDASLSQTQRRVALRELSVHPVQWPLSEKRRRRGESPTRKPVPKSTLQRWLEAYRREGYPGLLPKRRADRGKLRRPEAEA
jgi:hypothetical protein